jgi:hypothetical protein
VRRTPRAFFNTLRSYVHSPNWGARDAPIRGRIVEPARAALPSDLRAPPAGRDAE